METDPVKLINTDGNLAAMGQAQWQWFEQQCGCGG